MEKYLVMQIKMGKIKLEDISNEDMRKRVEKLLNE